MPKPGYTRIIVKSEVRSMLEKLAAAQGYGSINRLLESWIRVHPGVHPTTPSGAINEEIRRSETGPETGFFQERKCRNVVSAMVGRAGLEPATFCTSGRCPNQARRPAHFILILGRSHLFMI